MSDTIKVGGIEGPGVVFVGGEGGGGGVADAVPTMGKAPKALASWLAGHGANLIISLMLTMEAGAVAIHWSGWDYRHRRPIWPDTSIRRVHGADKLYVLPTSPLLLPPLHHNVSLTPYLPSLIIHTHISHLLHAVSCSPNLLHYLMP